MGFLKPKGNIKKKILKMEKPGFFICQSQLIITVGSGKAPSWRSSK